MSEQPALRSFCPVANALDVVGDRWTLLIIRDLFAGKHRFGDLVGSPEHIPTNILAERLKRLEGAGLIAALPYQSRPTRYEYHLTPRGRALSPILDALAVWGLDQFPGTRPPARWRGPDAAVLEPAVAPTASVAAPLPHEPTND